ncbi:YcbK family protein [Pararhizobium sp. YC-54]|uniref:YcbK family protein n=1 Tax=Pararhizobium sp. YC-54 TaxID=2986920 RepID=UPI0021F6A070|nr:YcbK family protein [Pararhizobium sp. YC-54]MCV9997109.1 YcbK family protein [Pararhizobium sp. YC-54]
MTANVARPALSGDPTLRHILQKAATIRSLGCALALSVSAMILSGCVTAAKETAEAASAVDEVVPEIASADSAQAAPGTYEDQQVSAVGANGQQQSGAQANAMMPAPNNGQPSSLTMQSTGLNATANSIFAVQTPNAVPVQAQDAATVGGNAPLAAGQATGVNPATNSLFNSGQPAANPIPLPLEGPSNAAGAAAATQQVASAEIGPDGTPLPVAVPIPSSRDGMRGGNTEQPAAAAQTASVEAINGATATLPDSGNAEDDGDKPDQAKKPLTLAGLFAAKRKNRSQFDNDRFAKTPAKKTLAASNVKQQQIAALGFTDLPGVRTTSMFATVDDSQAEHDDDSATVEMASLSGLARLAPNGLWLQTEKVETGCFQPELLQVLKVVETHYGQKIMVTSGLRDLQHNARAGGRKHSLHTTCQAADIQVPGVSKWDLAEYLRTIPGRGGVGTYCHTESVHIDTGEARDWNWRCRRRKA